MNHAPGWYPDPENSDYNRYWDGSAWTEHRAPTVPQEKPPAAPLASFPPAAGQAAKGKSPLVWILAGVGGVIVLCCGGALIAGAMSDGSGTEASESGAPLVQERTTSESTTSEPEPTEEAPTPVESAEPTTTSTSQEPPPSAPPKKGTIQERFLERISQADEEYSSAPDNEIKRKMVLTKRDEDLCKLLDSGKFTGWEGTVENVVSAGEFGGLELEIGDGVTIQTWNNRFSDAMDGTLIDPSSDLYPKLADLSSGDKVKVSGTFKVDQDCVKVSNLTEIMTASSPDFIVKFSAIERQ